MPTKEQWEAVHADLMGQLNLPCKLRFSTFVRIGKHTRDTEGDGCTITVNPDIDFKVPAHLILHEASHHVYTDACDCFWGHCEHWAHVLLSLYHRTGVTLPEGTKFDHFAKVAGIIHREYKDEPAR